MYKSVLFWWVMLLFPGVATGQLKDLAFLHLNQENGLSQTLCTHISRDSKGFIWVGTIDGLNRYDGQQIKTYRPDPADPQSIEGNNITSPCFEDSQGDLWFTTNNAIHRYDYSTDKFEVIHISNGNGKILKEDYSAFYFDNEGRLWCRVGDGENGLLHIFNCTTRSDSVICKLGGYDARAMTNAAGKVVKIIATNWREKSGFEEISLQPEVTRISVPADHYHTQVKTYKSYAEGDSIIWVGSSLGLLRYDIVTREMEIFPLPVADEQASGIYDVCPFRGEFLFLSSQAYGLFVFDKIRRRFINHYNYDPSIKYSLQSNETRTLFIDRDENLWIAQWGKGLTHVNINKSKFDLLPGTKGGFLSIISPAENGRVLCSSKQGIYVYSSDKKLVQQLPAKVPQVDNFLGLRQIPGESGIFHDQYNHLFSLDTVHWRLQLIQSFNPDSIRFRQAITLHSGKTLMACFNGLFFIGKNRDNKFILKKLSVQNAPQVKGISSIFQNKSGFIFLTFNSSQLVICKENDSGLELIKTIEGVGEGKAFLDAADTGNTWMAGTLGLLYITPDCEVRLLNETADGLHNETYYTVLPDHLGRLWLPGNSGLWCYDPLKKTSHCYQPSDGLFFKEFNTGSWYQDAHGIIWAGGLGGLVSFNPDSIRLLPLRPPVHFTKIMINDQPDTSGIPATVATMLDLPYDQNTVSFEFVGIDFSDPTTIQYKYRLVGYDNTWVTSGKRGFVRYANLPPGNYTLEVKASNSDGVWSEDVRQFSIHIQTPFWQTWWFYLLCLCFIGALIYGWFRYRLYQAVKLERIRVQISSDLHDDVGTLLAGLAMQSEALEITAAEKDKNKLRRISELSREAMAHMRDTVWAIDARKDKFENLIDRMREHAEEVLTPRDIRFRIDADPTLLKRNLPTQMRQNLYLIFKEAVTNAAKHSNGQFVDIHLQKTANGLELRIADNGTVQEKTYKTTGSGTSNMKMRAEKIGGTLEISRNEGFCVTLFLPGKV